MHASPSGGGRRGGTLHRSTLLRRSRFPLSRCLVYIQASQGLKAPGAAANMSFPGPQRCLQPSGVPAASIVAWRCLNHHDSVAHMWSRSRPAETPGEHAQEPVSPHRPLCSHRRDLECLKRRCSINPSAQRHRRALPQLSAAARLRPAHAAVCQGAVRPHPFHNLALRLCRRCRSRRSADRPCCRRPAAAAAHLPPGDDCSSSEEGNIAESVNPSPAGLKRAPHRAAYSPCSSPACFQVAGAQPYIACFPDGARFPSANWPCCRPQAHQPTDGTSRGLLSSHGCTDTGRLQKANRWQKQGGNVQSCLEPQSEDRGGKSWDLAG